MNVNKQKHRTPLEYVQYKVSEDIQNNLAMDSNDAYYLGVVNTINTILNIDKTFTKDDWTTYLKSMRDGESELYSDNIRSVIIEIINQYEEGKNNE